MRTRWSQPLVFLLVAAQLLLAVPASAFGQTQVADPANHPCDTMVEAAKPGDCPCCPDGAASMKDCLVSCTLAPAAVATRVVQVRAAFRATQVEGVPALSFTSFSAPPLKPPPIH